MEKPCENEDYVYVRIKRPAWAPKELSLFDALVRKISDKPYAFISDWAQLDASSYYIARLMGVTSDVFESAFPDAEPRFLAWAKGYDSPFDAAVAIARRCESYRDFYLDNPAAAEYIWRRGLTDAFVEKTGLHKMTLTPKFAWVEPGEDKEAACLRIASKHKGLKDWYRGHASSYNYAQRKGWARAIGKTLGWVMKGSSRQELKDKGAI